MNLPPPKLKPYYKDNWVTIYHGDNRIISKSIGRFDLMLTDPPYGLNEAAGKNKSRGKLAISKDYGNDDWDNNPPSDNELYSLIEKSNNSVIFGGNYFNLPPSPCWFVWDKDNGESDFADCELAWTNLNCAVRRIKWMWAGMLQQDMKNKDVRVHPTQKPVGVMQWCIEKSIKAIGKVEFIFDPYGGSGTTCRAAKNLKIKSVMIEREEKYCMAAANRMSQEVLL